METIKKDITGQQFGHLLVIKFLGNVPIGTYSGYAKRRGLWLCKCFCGKETKVFTQPLIKGNTKSCGCFGKRNDKGEKLCAKCKSYISLDKFNVTSSYCNSCIGNLPKAIYDKEKASKYFKESYPRHREKRLAYSKTYRLKNLEKVQARLIKWKKDNPNYKKNKWKSDTNFRIKENLRGRIYKAVKGFNKGKSSAKLLGCSINDFKNHISNLFIEDMTWENYGKWHIDHIKPCSLFDLSKIEEQEKCFHYTNLQPLWAVDNQIKSNKYEIHKDS